MNWPSRFGRFTRSNAPSPSLPPQPLRQQTDGGGERDKDLIEIEDTDDKMERQQAPTPPAGPQPNQPKRQRQRPKRKKSQKTDQDGVQKPRIPTGTTDLSILSSTNFKQVRELIERTQIHGDSTVVRYILKIKAKARHNPILALLSTALVPKVSNTSNTTAKEIFGKLQKLKIFKWSLFSRTKARLRLRRLPV